MGKTSSAVKNRYNAKVYDQLPIRVPKGCKSVIECAAGSVGESVNAFVTGAILARLGLDAWPDRSVLLPERTQPDAMPTPPMGEYQAPGIPQRTPVSTEKNKKEIKLVYTEPAQPPKREFKPVKIVYRDPWHEPKREFKPLKPVNHPPQEIQQEKREYKLNIIKSETEKGESKLNIINTDTEEERQ